MIRFHCPSGVVVLPGPQERWIVMNVFARSCVGLDVDGLALMTALCNDGVPVSFEDRAETYQFWNIERLSNADGLMADPTPFQRELSDWPDAERLTGPEFLERLERHFIFVRDVAAYRERFAPKRSLLDQTHFGNFHQKLGQILMLQERTSPADWWLKQKFNDGLSGLANNLYGVVQGRFLEAYIGRRFGPGVTVVDLGCGPGYFTDQIAATGATVLGVDPSEDYIDLARSRAAHGAQFEQMAVGTPHGCDAIATDSADIVFMSDALLFYFVTAEAEQTAEIEILFSDIRRVLRPDGLFINVEPHYLFWLAPWLGRTEAPFTVLTEYRKKSFSVTPTISELIQAYASGGFQVAWMDELYPDPSFTGDDPRAYHFATQFPQWQLFELRPTSDAG